MQQLLKLTGLIFLITLFSCETLQYKEYRLHARNSKEDIELNAILSEKGIYKKKMDSSMHKLSFMYSARENDLGNLNVFLDDNALLNLDTTAEVFDSSYLFIDEQNAILDSLDRIDSILQVKKMVEDLKKREKFIIDSAAAAVLRQESLKASKDSAVSPIIDILDVF